MSKYNHVMWKFVMLNYGIFYTTQIKKITWKITWKIKKFPEKISKVTGVKNLYYLFLYSWIFWKITWFFTWFISWFVLVKNHITADWVEVTFSVPFFEKSVLKFKKITMKWFEILWKGIWKIWWKLSYNKAKDRFQIYLTVGITKEVTQLVFSDFISNQFSYEKISWLLLRC